MPSDRGISKKATTSTAVYPRRKPLKFKPVERKQSPSPSISSPNKDSAFTHIQKSIKTMSITELSDLIDLANQAIRCQIINSRTAA
jgi:hypothetical protein